jgi:hypothetical protein
VKQRETRKRKRGIFFSVWGSMKKLTGHLLGKLLSITQQKSKRAIAFFL